LKGFSGEGFPNCGGFEPLADIFAGCTPQSLSDSDKLQIFVKIILKLFQRELLKELRGI
jgi:hypothetical protein